MRKKGHDRGLFGWLVGFASAWQRAVLIVGALAAMLDISNSTLSFHLKELVHAGLVSAEREGRNLHYRPALACMNALLAYLTDHCCLGQRCAPSGAKRRTTC